MVPQKLSHELMFFKGHVHDTYPRTVLKIKVLGRLNSQLRRKAKNGRDFTRETREKVFVP